MSVQQFAGVPELMFPNTATGLVPERSAQQAVETAQKYIGEGYRWVVDLDLERFSDGVNHDRLEAKIAERIGDKRMLKNSR